MIVAISLMKSRAKYIKKVIRELNSGFVVPEKIIFYINKNPYLLDKGFKKKPKVKGAEFKYVPPMAALKKAYGAIKDYWGQDKKIILMDDDCHTRKWTLRLIDKYSKKYPDCAIGLRGYRFPTDSWDSTVRYRGWKMKKEEFVDTLNGGWFQLVKPEFFQKDFLDLEKYGHLGVTKSDEVFISYGLAKTKTKRIVIPHKERIGFFQRDIKLGKNTIHDWKRKQLKEFHNVITAWRK